MAKRKTWPDRFHRYLANPIMRRVAGRLPGQALLETTGRRSGQPRRTPVGGRIEGDSFWMVSNHGRAAGYVKNIEANPRVRLQIRDSGSTVEHSCCTRTMPALGSSASRSSTA